MVITVSGDTAIEGATVPKLLRELSERIEAKEAKVEAITIYSDPKADLLVVSAYTR